METLEEKELTAADNQSAKKAKVSIPCEIMEEIISRLPVKSVLRFRSLSKQWLSLISNPSFTKLHFTRASAAHRTTLFFSAFECVTGKRHFFSAALVGGPVTHIMTLDHASCCAGIQPQDLNGLVCFTCVINGGDDGTDVDHTTQSYAFFVNPSIHTTFKLADPYTNGKGRIRYLFGFDESTNDHKVLVIKDFSEPSMEIMIFSLSSYSWEKIDAEPPIGFSSDSLYLHRYSSVCVNSVVHLLLAKSSGILAFDLKTYKFSIIETPDDVLDNQFCIIIKVNGCIGVVFHDYELGNYKMHIWILHDYENRVWVREIITFPEPWIELHVPSPIHYHYPFPFPEDFVNMDEIIFCSGKVSPDMDGVLVYNKKNRCFKSLEFTSGPQFRLLRRLTSFNHIRCFVESMVPL